MKILVAGMAAAFAFVMTMIGLDVFVHDQTLREAIHGMSHQSRAALMDLLGLAWQYKAATFIGCAIIIAVFYVRRVPEIRNQ